MRTVTITRTETGAQGTFGVLRSDRGFRCATGEPPWEFNVQDKSCILFGIFKCKYSWSESRKRDLYHVESVPGRTGILFHSGNFCGNKDKGFKSDTLGCILLGQFLGFLDNQKAIMESKVTIVPFEEEMRAEDFELNIVWKPEVIL